MAAAKRKALSANSRPKKPPSPAIELRWGAFMRRHTPAHLLTGIFDRNEKPITAKRRELALLRALARAVCKRGCYAVTILHDQNGIGDLAMVAAEHRHDADRFARTVQARQASRFGSWLSHRSFEIGPAAYQGIALALAEG